MMEQPGRESAVTLGASSPRSRRDLTIAVVGVGAVGNGVCQALGQIGIGCVNLIDGDRVSPHNHPYCPMLRQSELRDGLKAVAVAAEGMRRYPLTRWREIPRWFCEVGFGELAGCDAIFACVDNELARLEIAYACLRLDIPMVDAGVAEDGSPAARVTWFPGPRAACFACLIPPQRLGRLLQGVDFAGGSCSGPEWRDGASGRASPLLNWVAGEFQAEVGLRLVAGEISEPETTSWSMNLLRTPSCGVYRAGRREDCLLDHFGYDADRLEGPGKAGCTIRDWMEEAHAVSGVSLDWPVCVSARCVVCGARHRPFRYVSVVRSKLSCPACGGGPLIPLRLIRSIEPGSEWARATFESLGLSPHHWYRKREGD